MLWKIYRENIDPVIKILHVPTTEILVRDASNGLVQGDSSSSVLLVAICYAAVTSMDDEEVTVQFGLQRLHMLSQYRLALEQALLEANFLRKADLASLQGLVLFLTTARGQEISRMCWSLTGLVVRLAQSIQIHRDGVSLGIPPFETEMRRRLWWTICTLDLQFSEELGMDLAITPGSFDTELPSNINDFDIWRGMVAMPIPRLGQTDCTIARIRYEFCALWRRLYTSSSTMASMSPADDSLTLTEWERLVVDLYRQMKGKFLDSYSLDQDHLFRMVAVVLRAIMAKMVLVVYRPKFRGTAALSSEVRNNLWLVAIEIVECHRNLDTSPEYRPWRWLFQSHMQWNAVAYILGESMSRPWTAISERAWELAVRLLDGKTEESDGIETTDNAVKNPLPTLFMETRKHREAEIARLRADPEAARLLDAEDDLAERSIFSGFVRGKTQELSQIHDRWRSLVGQKDHNSVLPSQTKVDSRMSAAVASTEATDLCSPVQPVLTPEQQAEIVEQVLATNTDPSEIWQYVSAASMRVESPW
ncbi:Fungal specific transcription factor domain-containing protein [Pleurostoma richardsiae]|uniref:Fungal specific transcription factor domain-containing protein n=1 Tax=Pleurostoma richardsiae TaxID=41990 RepID=A0AA38S3B8_9PEZI|nr:Fungal specific transcription factor domain-containing protein [Pleurostoma richardsiae]